MRRINPLVFQNYRLFIKVCNQRQQTIRTSLVGIAPAIRWSYTKFMRTKPNWSRVTRNQSLANHRVHLESNYDHSLMNVIKDRLKQNGRDGGNCPYCGFGEITELDHFLPSSSYPEFSIYTYNLIPSCHRCNNLKRTFGHVAFNPYYDVVINREYLKCSIRRVAHGSVLYKANFTLDLSLLTPTEIVLVNGIYQQLRLLVRYGENATNYIERVRVDYIKNPNNLLANFLQARYDSCLQSLGGNHYETAILKCLVFQNMTAPIWP